MYNHKPLERGGNKIEIQYFLNQTLLEVWKLKKKKKETA